MSDESVRAALRSDARLVLVEAPAGCGKTYQGANYAREMATAGTFGRPLILTHTHAACAMFAAHTKGVGSGVDIRTIDSVIGQIASVYHAGLQLPADIAGWLRQREAGHAELALKVAGLLSEHPMIPSSLVQRHPIVICDEHQDSNSSQHSLVMALFGQGAKLRLFADPMQKVFGDSCDWNWKDLSGQAHAFEQLDVPHRWANGCPHLGRWTLKAREALKTGGKVDLTNGVPASVSIVFAENQAQKTLDYRFSAQDRKLVDSFEKNQASLLILTPFNKTARSLRSLFNRRIPLWEGHTRTDLEKLVDAERSGEGNPLVLAAAVVRFMGKVGKGFSPSAFGDEFQSEVREGCIAKRRGKRAKIQELARVLIADANHRGVAKVLRRLWELKNGKDPHFADVEIDSYREFWDAIRLGEFDAVDVGLAQIAHHRSYSRPTPPDKAISTIHKAKGLEFGNVAIIACDGNTFPDKPEARCLLYVAISRAKDRLMLVVSRTNQSPLLKI